MMDSATSLNRRRTDFRRTPAYAIKLVAVVGILASLVFWAL